MARIPCSYINLTPHEIVVEITSDGERISIPPSPPPLRVATEDKVVGHTIEWIPIHETTPCEGSIADALERLAAERSRVTAGTLFTIVSGLALDLLAPHMTREQWTYTVAPDTGPHSAVRDDQGRIVAVRAFRLGRR